MDTKVHNVKLSFPLGSWCVPILLKHFNVYKEEFNSFNFVFLEATFVVYKTNGYINITGLADFDRISQVIEEFIKELQKHTSRELQIPFFLL